MNPLHQFNTQESRPNRLMHAFTLIELLVVVAIIGVLAGLLLPVLSRAQGRARNIACLSQLRQLGMATRMYTDENNNLLPSAEILPSLPLDPTNQLPRICDILAPYVGKSNSGGTNASAPVFKCPSDNLKRFETEGSSYEWNTQLNGHKIDETRSSENRFVVVIVSPEGTTSTNGSVQLRFEPATTPLLLDYDPIHPRSPRPGQNVVYMDNHAAAMEPPSLGLP